LRAAKWITQSILFPPPECLANTYKKKNKNLVSKYIHQKYCLPRKICITATYALMAEAKTFVSVKFVIMNNQLKVEWRVNMRVLRK
jgi:hypothetical protein